MNVRAGILLTSALGWAIATAAGAASPTPNLKSGNFYGPDAQEIGGVFTLSQTLGIRQIGEGGGGFVGKKN